jgi:hypothetical protein
MVRPSIFLAALSAFPSHASDGIPTGPGALQGRATIDISVRIPAVLRLDLLDHPSVLHITEEDSARGEVEVAGTRILLVANHRHGFTLQAALADGFSEAAIEGLAAPVRVAPGSGAVPMPSMVGAQRPMAKAVRYRFRFAPGLMPGDHPWPLALSVTRL